MSNIERKFYIDEATEFMFHMPVTHGMSIIVGADPASTGRMQ